MEQVRMDAVIREQFDKCERLGKDIVNNFGIEEIHHFRVETKRLRALLRLAAAAGHSHIKPKLPGNLKVYYGMAGVLRTLQLQKKALEEAAVRMHQGAPAICLAVLDDRIGIAENMVKLYLNSSDPFSKGRAGWHTAIASPVTNETFISAKIKVFTLSCPSGLPDDEQLHVMRKAMKDLLYCWPHFSKEDIEDAIPKGLFPRKQLDSCAHLLGDLHDIVVQLSLLRDKRFLLCACPYSARFLEAAEQLWLGDKQVLLEKKIRDLLQGTAVSVID